MELRLDDDGTQALFGYHDENLRMLEDEFDVKISSRGHEIFVQSLVRLLGAQSTIKVVGTAGTAAEAQRAAVAYSPDVILMDFELPDGDGAGVTEAIDQHHHAMAILGPRFLLLRPRTPDRQEVALRAMENDGRDYEYQSDGDATRPE